MKMPRIPVVRKFRTTAQAGSGSRATIRKFRRVQSSAARTVLAGWSRKVQIVTKTGSNGVWYQGEPSVVKDFLTTATDGKQYRLNHYNLEAVKAVFHNHSEHFLEMVFAQYRATISTLDLQLGGMK